MVVHSGSGGGNWVPASQPSLSSVALVVPPSWSREREMYLQPTSLAPFFLSVVSGAKQLCGIFKD